MGSRLQGTSPHRMLGKKYGSIYTFYFGPHPVVVFCGYEAVKEALVDHGEDFIGRGRQPTVDRVFQGYGILRKSDVDVTCERILSASAVSKLNVEAIQDMIPMIMNHLPGPHQKITTLLEELNDFVAERVKMNQETLDPQNPRDYIDCFLMKMHEEKDNPDSEFNMRNLILSLNNLFFAGGETVATTLKHGFLILLKYPDLQAKIYKEIDDVIGRDRQPNIDDRSKMPYTDAVIHEIQRFSDVIPMNAPHSATRDTIFRGYTIPKGTGVCALLCSVLEDPTYFATPDKFNPNHFLDSEGNFKRNEAFAPFSFGKRLCLGEGLARMELFLFFTSILQNFELTSQTQFTDSDIYPRMTGFANVPISYQMSFVSRGF
ncbi:cytochrome P450 2G1-like [Bufo bufo]|uniref:cytochrome P450 2G1-like n=1 Tax=Bufo bufo TaxID=8384 RepID=UPI001ABE0FB5|nr:cytochrome P450 2G1-like [Bufo bufo]